jgi:hypothetical protein
MTLFPSAIRKVDSVLENISRQIWGLLTSFPTARLHALLENLELSVPSILDGYCGATIRSWTQIPDDEGALGTTARASFKQAATKFRHWPLELVFHFHMDRPHNRLSIMGRNIATLRMVGIHPMGDPNSCMATRLRPPSLPGSPSNWTRNGYPIETQPFLPAMLILQKLAPLWEHGVHTWAQILGRALDDRPFYFDERELQ